MTDTSTLPRTGGIDRVGGIETLDLVAFNDGKNPFGNPFMDNGFREGVAYYRGVIDHWRMHGFGRVADLGSGYARWTLFLAEVNAAVTGFERNAEAVALSRKLAAHFDLSNATFEAADITKLPVEDESFDAVWCYNVLQFVDRGKLFREAHRILAPGGTFVIGVYNGPGRVIEKLFTGFKAGGIANHTAQFALRSLRQGPLFDDGNGTFGSAAHIAEVLDRYGFDLDPTRPVEEEMHRRAVAMPERSALLEALPAFADRFESDPAFAAEMLETPQIAYLLPMNLHLCAIRH